MGAELGGRRRGWRFVSVAYRRATRVLDSGE